LNQNIGKHITQSNPSKYICSFHSHVFGILCVWPTINLWGFITNWVRS